ncbi:MAG: CBS domain-containing protein [Candidatus Brocadiae bacterium]|nr:CBS domain-containing protein [Candidatus Brocadiia bacterium]
MATVGDVCTRSPRVCGMEATLAEAAKVMWEADCGAIPVVDAERKVVGMITDRDIAMALATRGEGAAGTRVRDIAQTRVVACRADESMAVAFSRMAKFQLRRLPVVGADGRIEGLLSLSDAVRCSGRWMGPKGEDVGAGAIVQVLQAIGVSPDTKMTMKVPAK